MAPRLTGKEILIQEPMVKLLPQVDALIFDIDGVMMDVSQSFPVVVGETLSYYLRNVLGWPTSGPVINSEEVELFKQAGGFNSDEDLTHAVLLLMVAKAMKSGTRDVMVLRQSSPTLREFATEIGRQGGGLRVAEAMVNEMLQPRQRRFLNAQVSARLILQLFREIYAGAKWCEKLYGIKPEYVNGEGFIEKEMPLLDTSLLRNLPVRFAVLSGRTWEETQLVIDRLNLAGIIPPECRLTVTDGYRKPDPRSLSVLRQRMRFRRAIYIGDTLDDLQTVIAYRERGGSQKAPVHSCLVLSGYAGETGQRQFLERGAEIIAPDVNRFLSFFRHALRGQK